MCSVKERAFLEDIDEAIRRIQSYTAGMEMEMFPIFFLGVVLKSCQ
jgi:hypothetical protein